MSYLWQFLRRGFVRILSMFKLDRLYGDSAGLGYSQVSYSQEGEDLILSEMLGPAGKGYYVDVGAYHPRMFSNTYLFYQRGWSGINIDATPGSMTLFRRLRARDVNLEIAISDRKETQVYYCFNEPALNGFCGDLAVQRTAGQFFVTHTINIETLPLVDVFERHLAPGVSLDFMNIDVEGFELQVLRGNDWARFRPRIILIEDLDFRDKPVDQIGESRIAVYLKVIGYDLLYRTPRTSFYVDGRGR